MSTKYHGDGKIFANKDYTSIVCHSNGDAVVGFKDEGSAKASADERTTRAKELKLSCTYVAVPFADVEMVY